MTVIVLADIVGRIGRRAVQAVLPKWIETYKPTLVVANCENLAHGAGVTKRSLNEMFSVGIDVFTSGNHIWDKQEYAEVFADTELNKKVLKPLNDNNNIGNGYTVIEKNGYTFAIISVLGQVFFEDEISSPFDAIEKVLEKIPDGAITLVDFHAEATSEKAVLGRYFDGRVSAVLGSHTHVPTADERILPNGTATISDVGMTGAHNESIGIRYESALATIKDHDKLYLTPPDYGQAEINAVVLEFKSGSKFPNSIRRLREIVEIKGIIEVE